MIRIGCPFIEYREGRVCLVANIQNEGENYTQKLWFSVENDYREYLVSETADAFVVVMLLRAVVSRQDIVVDAPLSERLYHNLQNSVLYAVAKCCYGKSIGNANVFIPSISCQGTLSRCFDSKGVGTGCSLGVDSFSVIKRYYLDIDSKNLPSYRLSHLTCFNVGAFGSLDTEMTRNSFFLQVGTIKEFAREIGLPVVSVDTNIRAFFPEYNFNWSHTYLNMSCVLALQKLWKRYLYASGYSLDYFSWDIRDSAHYEFFLLPNLSTESTDLISADMDKPRSEKVRIIADDPIAQANLNVCLKEQRINNGRILRSDVSNYRNCGICEKCLRTMLQLDIYEKLPLFKDIFDLSQWEENRTAYIQKVILNKDSVPMYEDIFRTLENSRFKSLIDPILNPPSPSFMQRVKRKGEKVLKRIWRNFKSLFKS